MRFFFAISAIFQRYGQGMPRLLQLETRLILRPRLSANARLPPRFSMSFRCFILPDDTHGVFRRNEIIHV